MSNVSQRKATEVKNVTLDLENLVTNADKKGDEDVGQRDGGNGVKLEAREAGNLARTTLIGQVSLGLLLPDDDDKSTTGLSIKDISWHVKRSESWRHSQYLVGKSDLYYVTDLCLAA
jgi:hypothetical protein